jgi:8-oxo-dGTP pyrophosphatase MutT (NUDIX family)
MIKKVQVWIFTPEKKCLLLKTNEDRGGFWQPVTGSLESDENTDPKGWAKGALREATEETGLSFVGPMEDCQYSFTFQSARGPVEERVFANTVEKLKAPKIDPKEHEDYAWVTAEQAEKKIKFDSNKAGLKAALKQIFGAMAWLIFVPLLAMALCAPYGLAAQDGHVRVDGAAIRVAPQDSAEIIELRKKGDKLRISSETREGWFKTRSSQGKLGWIFQEDIIVDSYKTAYDFAHLDRTEREKPKKHRSFFDKFSLRLGGGLGFIMPSGINDRLGNEKWKGYRGHGLMGRLGYEVSPDWALAFRIERLKASGRTLSYDMEWTSYPVLAGAEYIFARMGFWQFALGMYLGLGLGHEVSIVAVDQPTAPNRASLSGITGIGLVEIHGLYRVTNWLALGSEVGARYSTSLTQHSTGAPFNGDSPFFREGNTYRSLTLSETGPYIYLGAEVSF